MIRTLLTTSLLMFAAAPTAKLDILAWPGMHPDALGCVMQKELGNVDKRFKCGMKGYVNKADVCTDPARFREGPQLDDKAAQKIHPYVKHATLKWEGGRLQSIDFELTGMIPHDEIRRAFNLGEKLFKPRENVRDVTIRTCGEVRCLMLQAFEADEAVCFSKARPVVEE